MTNIAILAPGHDELDRRVNRTIESASMVFDHVVVFYEKELSVGAQPEWPNVTFLYYSRSKSIGGTLKPDINFICSAFKEVAEPDVFYIHDSGIAGLGLIKELNNRFHRSALVFDYHDWIKWEIYYQTKKRRMPLIFLPFFISITYFFIIKYFRGIRNIKAFVGISNSQLCHFFSDFKLKKTGLNTLVVPNTRVKLTDSFSVSDGPIYIIWIGNIMPGRDLDKLLFYVKKLRSENKGEDIRIALIGKIYTHVEDIYHHNFIEVLGGYSSDFDVLSLLPRGRCIGVFLGWEDLMCTGINAVASPNKIYTYINVGIPFIYHKSLADIDKIVREIGCKSVNDFDSFKNAIYEIGLTYSTYLYNVRRLKSNIHWDNDVKLDLCQFLGYFGSVN